MRKPFTMKLGLAFLGLLPGAALQAQTIAPQQALEKALAVREQWAGPGYPAADVRVSSAYADANGLEHVYMQQQSRGIAVYNKMQALSFMRGKLATHAGDFVPLKLLVGQSATPSLPAAAAVSRTLQHLKQSFAATPALLAEDGGAEARQTFSGAGVARRDIVASLTWATDDPNHPRLAWNVNIEMLDSPDWWNVRVDAATGAILGQDNWTVEEAAACAEAGVATSHTAAARLLPPPPPPPTTTTASFLVVPFPRESPGTLGVQTDTNPWLRAGATNNAVTYGWNFDGTTNYTTTRGNNVSAYDDAASTNVPGNFATSTTAAPVLTFNSTPDFQAPAKNVANRNAAVTNLFYWNNIIHDVTYQYGFTEAAGNFQADNIGRGGAGNDYVRAEAQDGGGVNNANFATPADGTSGRMQMYLWNPVGSYAIQVTAPVGSTGRYLAAEGSLSTNNYLFNIGPVSGQLALYVDAGSNPVTSFACGAYGGTTPLTGKIALIYRSTPCSYAVKVKNAQLAGAIGVIMINNVAGAAVVMTGNDNTITIPAVMVSQNDGATLAGQIGNNLQVTLPRNFNPQIDGDFDNGIMVHEYGHGVSTRLTGGPANSSCLGNAEQGGEGWSDYLALMLTTDWTAAQLTDGPTARPMGTYVFGQSPTTGRGIRRYPYSTSLTVNPLTYANVATSPEVHNIGEVWCATLWDMTWNIIQQRGTIGTNLYNGTANGGNNIALNLVLQGMKLQPCSPGFLDARDGILAADSLLYQGQYHCAIWTAFARRGMGYSAQEGSSNSATDQTPAYDTPPPVTLEKLPALIAGNTFTIEYKLTSTCQVPAAPYTLTDDLPAGLQFVSSNTGGTLVGTKVTFRNITFTTPGQTIILRFQAQAVPGASCAITTPVNDNQDGSTLGSFAAQALSGSTNWVSTTTYAYSPTHSWWANTPIVPTDFVLTSNQFTPTGLSVLSFYHYFDFESTYDGGNVELSTDNGVNWLSTDNFWIQNGYNSTFDASTAAPGQRCFSGRSTAVAGRFTRAILDLRSFAGIPLRMRFRYRSDNGNSNSTFDGWYVDDIQVINGCGGNQTVELRNGSNAVQSTQTVVTYLLNTNITAQKSGLAQASEFSAQPNPFGAQGLQLRLSLPAAQSQLAFTLYDVAGRQLLHRSAEHVSAGASTLNWPEAAGLPAGLYLVRIQLADGSSTMLRVEHE